MNEAAEHREQRFQSMKSKCILDRSTLQLRAVLKSNRLLIFQMLTCAIRSHVGRQFVAEIVGFMSSTKYHNCMQYKGKVVAKSIVVRIGICSKCDMRPKNSHCQTNICAKLLFETLIYT